MLSGLAAVGVAAGLVAFFDAVLEARVRSGSDNALRMSVLLPYVGVGSRYVLARAAGTAALVLAGTAVAIGLERAARLAQGQRLPATAGRLHQQLSVLALALVVAHVVLPYTSSVTPFGGWPTALVPFDQPYSFGSRGKIFESFGILAFYLLLALGPSYWLLRRRRAVWAVFHSLTVGAYGLAVLHALFLGSDFVVRGPARVALIAVQLPITLALVRRLRAGGPAGARLQPGGAWREGARDARSADRLARRLGILAAMLLSVAVVALTIAGLAGAPLGGFPL